MSVARSVSRALELTVPVQSRGAARARTRALGLRARRCRVLSLALLVGLSGACTRASAAALLPSISLGVLARHALQATSRDGSWAERWQAVALVALQFRPRSVAAELPPRAELMPETWVAPCDSEDFICLEEAAEAEQELRAAFGELQ